MVSNRKISSRRSRVALVVLILTSIGAGVVILVSQAASKRSMGLLSEAFMKEVSARVRADTLEYLDVGPKSLETVRQLTRETSADLAEDRVLASWFRALLSAHREIELLAFGRPDGGFLLVKRMPDGSLSTKRMRPMGAVVESTWEHDRQEWEREPVFADRVDSIADAYDPRQRHWYQQAIESGRLSWVEPYNYRFDQMLGISCSLPVFNADGSLSGVLSADVGIVDLSRQLHALEIGDRAETVILTASGRLVAHSAFVRGSSEAEESSWLTAADGESWLDFVLQPIADFPDARLANAFARRPPGGLGIPAEPFTFDYAGEPQTAIFEFFALSSQRWMVGVLAPQSDFMGSVIRDHRLSLAVTLLCLGLAVGLATVLVRRADRLEIELLVVRNVEMQNLVEELEVKNAQLERFSYTVSHDLKTPLLTIRGFLGMLERDMESGDERRVRDDIRRIRRASGTMAQLLSELFHLSRVVRLARPLEEVPLDEVVREVIDRLAESIAERGVEIDVAPDLPTVSGDRHRLREVFENLIDNAVRYLGDQPMPRVEVAMRQDGAERIFVVRDNGTGVDPRYQDKVFVLFERLHADAEGTGVGLALTKRIVELHSGSIWVESGGAGEGACFCFTLGLSQE